MSAIKLTDQPHYYPKHTVWRSTGGPVAYCGELVEGVFVYLNERESRELVRAWGWPTVEMYQALEVKLEEAQEKLAALEETVAPLRKLAKTVGKLELAFTE